MARLLFFLCKVSASVALQGQASGLNQIFHKNLAVAIQIFTGASVKILAAKSCICATSSCCFLLHVKIKKVEPIKNLQL